MTELTPDEIRRRLKIEAGPIVDELTTNGPSGVLDVDSGLTEGGIFVRMRHDESGAQVRLDFDPEQAGPGLIFLMLRLFSPAVHKVFQTMAEEGDDDA